jgi:PmbA protein
VAALGPDALIGIGTSVIDRVCTRDGEIQCEGMVSASAGWVRILNSAGLDATYRKTNLGMFMEGIRVNGTDMRFVGDNVSSTHLFTDADGVAATMLSQLERASRSASIETGSYPVLFTPHGVGAALMLPLAVAFNGKNVVERASRLAGRQGEKLFDGSLHLRDDATIAGRRAGHAMPKAACPARPASLTEASLAASCTTCRPRPTRTPRAPEAAIARMRAARCARP